MVYLLAVDVCAEHNTRGVSTVGSAFPMFRCDPFVRNRIQLDPLAESVRVDRDTR